MYELEFKHGEFSIFSKQKNLPITFSLCLRLDYSFMDEIDQRSVLVLSNKDEVVLYENNPSGLKTLLFRGLLEPTFVNSSTLQGTLKPDVKLSDYGKV